MTSNAFERDDRGVSAVVGFILVFGIVVLMLASYQAIVVPANNAEVEVDHHAQVANEMLELRNALVEAEVAGREGVATVTLGTQFPARTFGLNPPDPTGVLATTEPEPFSVHAGDDDVTERACGAETHRGESVSVTETRLLQYQPEYREFAEAGVLRAEHSVLYHEFATANVLRSNQRLVRGETVTITPIASDVHHDGRDAVALEVVPGFATETRIEDPTIELPTRLDEATWREALGDEVDPASVTVSDGVLTLDLAGKYTVRCAILGLDANPDSGPRSAFPEPDADADLLNPLEPIKLTDVDLDDGEAILIFENPDEVETVEFADLRVAVLYGTDPSTHPEYLTLSEHPEILLEPRGPFISVADLDLRVEPGHTRVVPMTGSDGENTVDLLEDHVFVLEVRFDDGTRAAYVVNPDP